MSIRELNNCGVCGGSGMITDPNAGFYDSPCPECMLKRAEIAADISVKQYVDGYWMMADPNRDDLRDKCNVEPHSNS